LQACGAKVFLLSQEPHHPDVPSGVEVIPERSFNYRASENRLRFVRIALNVLKSAYSRFRFLWHTSRLLRSRSVGLLWAVDWPMLSRYALIARLNRIPVVYETLDLVAEQTQGEAARTRELRRETQAVARLGGFIVAGDAFSDYYVKRCADAGFAVSPVVCENVPEQQAEAVRPVTGRLRMIFLGALIANRNLPNLLRGMAMTTSDVTLTLQGENWLGDDLSREIARLEIEDKVHICGPVPPSEMIDVAAEYDVGVISLEPVSLNEMLAPTTKLYSYMAAGLAVLGSDLPGIRGMVTENDNGWLVSGTEPEDWARAIDAVGFAPWAEVDEMKHRSLDAIRSRAWPIQRTRFLSEFERVVNGRGRSRRRDTQSPKIGS